MPQKCIYIVTVYRVIFKEINIQQDALHFLIIKTFSTMIIIIRFLSWAANQHKVISEGLCDTEDWSNDVENFALPSQEKKPNFNIY